MCLLSKSLKDPSSRDTEDSMSYSKAARESLYLLLSSQSTGVIQQNPWNEDEGDRSFSNKPSESDFVPL